MGLVARHHKFYFVGAAFIFFARLREPILSPWPSLVAGLSCLSAHLSLRQPSLCKKLSSHASAELVDLFLLMLIAFPFAVVMLNSRTGDDLVRNRAHCIGLQVFTVLLSAHGFAPRFVFLLVGVPLLAHIMSAPHTATGQSSHLPRLLYIITGLSGALMFFLLEYCVRAQFSYLQSAHEVTRRCRSFEACRKRLFEKIFDASCVCNENSLILGSSSALDTLLNDGAPLNMESGAHSFLCDYVEDRKRFNTFLRTVASSMSLAVPLQVTLTVWKNPEEVTVFCMALADTPTASHSEERLFFLGFTFNRARSSITRYPAHEIDQQMAIAISSKSHQDSFKADEECITCWEQKHVLWRRVAFMSVMLLANLAIVMVCLQQGIYLYRVKLLSCLCVSAVGMFSAVGDLLQFQASNGSGESTHMRIQRRYLVITVQVVCRVLLEVNILTTSMQIHDVLMKHSCYLTMHMVFSISLAALADMSAPTYLCSMGPLQSSFWLWFHWQTHFWNLAAILICALIYLFSAYYLNLMRTALSNVSSALRDESVAKKQLDSLVIAYAKMHESIFDATCYLDHRSHTIESCSPQFEYLFGQCEGLPLLMFGSDMSGREIIHQALAEVTCHQESRAVAVLVRLAIKQAECGFQVARLTAILEPSHEPGKDFGRIFVGIQIQQEYASDDESADSCQSTAVSGFEHSLSKTGKPSITTKTGNPSSITNDIIRRFLDTGGDVHADDSISNCAESVVMLAREHRDAGFSSDPGARHNKELRR